MSGNLCSVDVSYIVPQGNHNNVSCGIVDEYDVRYINP